MPLHALARCFRAGFECCGVIQGCNMLICQLSDRALLRGHACTIAGNGTAGNTACTMQPCVYCRVPIAVVLYSYGMLQLHDQLLYGF